MYVRRLRLHGVKSLHIDLPTTGEALPEASRRRLVLQGASGSGKSTILDCIRLLWERFGDWIDWGPSRAEHMNGRHRRRLSSTDAALDNAELAALELGDFPILDKTLWIGVGQAHAWEDLKRQHPTAAFAGLIRSDSDPKAAQLELPPGDWQTFRQRSLAGSSPQANMVYFPGDNPTLAGTPQEGSRFIDTSPFNWSAMYNPQLDLDSVLLTVKTLRPEAFDVTLSEFNPALRHRKKRLVGFNNNGRLTIEGQTDFGTVYQHPPESLSSGEQQFLLLVAYTMSFLRPGGILLIDDPDLHIYIVMVRQLMQTLDWTVRQRAGQLIVASHSEHVGDFFSRTDERLDLNPWRGPQP